jgi:hypothetical protein
LSAGYELLKYEHLYLHEIDDGPALAGYQRTAWLR